MKFFGLEINDILVSFVLTLIVSGAITYFCHMRLKNIENAVTKQNQVLSSFITNVKNEINPASNDFSISDSSSVASAATPFALGSAATPFALASEEAIKAVAALEDKNSLIEVSDDDSDDSSSDESDDSETEDDEPERLEMNLGNFFEINQDDIKIIDLICIPQKYTNDNNTCDNSTSKIVEIFDVNTSDTDSDDESEEEIIVKKIEEVKVPVQIPMQVQAQMQVQEHSQAPEQIEVKVVSIEPTEILTEDLDASNFIKKIHTTHEEGETKLEKMKIEDLRYLAVTKGLGSKDEVKKIKKPELIALLEKV
jgi:hypothetical protein